MYAGTSYELGNFFWTVEKRTQPTLSAAANAGRHTLNTQDSYPLSGGYIYKGSINANSVQGLIGDAEL